MQEKVKIVFCLIFILIKKAQNSNLIWISLDGFRNTYLNLKYTPFLFSLSKNSTTVSTLHSVYPSLTFPNHFSAVTGKNAQQHGIMSNVMYDKDLGYFDVKNTDPRWWDPNNSTLPIWTIYELHSNESSAVLYWPGSNVGFGKNHNIYPSFYYPKYNSSCNYACRLSNAYKLIKSNKYKLIMIYISDIDKYGHEYGPESIEVKRICNLVDNEIKLLFKKLIKDNKLNYYNFMISSDHGMVQLDLSKIIILENILKKEFDYDVIFGGSLGLINIKNKSLINEVIKIISKQNGVLFVGTPNTMPKELYYSNPKHNADIIVIIKEGWSIYNSNNDVKYYLNLKCIKGQKSRTYI